MCNICFSETYNLPLLDHLKTRRLDLNLHTAHIHHDEATFYLYNLSGQIVGYQKYNYKKSKEKNNNPLEGRYFTRVKEGKVGVWGLESWNLSNTLFVTEGIFDACRLTYFGYSAICVFGNDVQPSTARWLWSVRKSRPVVSVCDGDSAGRRLRRLGNSFVTIEGYNDLGDASNEYVLKLIEEYAF